MLKKYSRFLALFFALFLAVSPLLTAAPASAAETYTVSGVWGFADKLANYASLPMQLVSFTSNGKEYVGFYYDGMTGYTCYDLDADDTSDYSNACDYAAYDGVWEDEAFRTVDFGSTPQTVSSEFYAWLTAAASPQASVDPPVVPPAGDGTSALVAVFGIFSGIGAWLTAVISSLVGMFYADNKLTFVGYLAVAGLAVGVVLLLLFLVSGFLRFRG